MAETPSPPPLQILLIEDNPGDVRLIREFLAEAEGVDFALTVALSLAEGLARLTEADFHLVLLDLTLPDSHGLETFLRLQKAVPLLPVIVLSGLEDEELALQAMREGAQDYLFKDQIEPNLLGRSIRYAIERKRLERELGGQKIFLRTILDTVPNLIYVRDWHGRFALVNQAFADLCGLAPEELVDRRPEELNLGEDIQRILATDGEVISALTQKLLPNEWVTNKEGGKSWLHITKLPFPSPDGSHPQLLCVATDISALKATEEELTASLARLRKAIEGTIKAMALIVEIRDPYTAGHQRRVARLAERIAKEMWLPLEQILGIKLAATIHDIGKIAIPAEILSKPGRITHIERELIKTHPQVGFDILKSVDFPWPIAQIVHQHHERLDGSGYPAGLKGEEIILEARILAVADVVEAMSSHRPYRPALGIQEALAEIEKHAGILYDQAVVRLCVHLFEDLHFELEEEHN
ncbi:MAG: HD domain-containing protein [Firmicutes bacterium]|nr:HD domain-containing protein [Bacillota bacterium]